MLPVLFIGLGANLTTSCNRSPTDTCRWAIRRFVSISGVEVCGISSFYRSAPIPASNQPDFINAVIKLATSADPLCFLQLLHEIEAEAGRVRGEVNAARVLDLDLLAVDDMVLSGPNLVLPHPRMAERAFVLHPLCEIAPDWRHPVLGQTASALRDALPRQRVVRLCDTKEDLLLRTRTLT